MVSAKVEAKILFERTSFLVALTQKHKGVNYGFTCLICTNKIPIDPKAYAYQEMGQMVNPII